MKPYFLCMESGGTKTLTCGIDLDGNIIYQYHNGVGSPAVDYELALKNIFEGIDNVYNSVVAVQNFKNNKENGIGSGFIYYSSNGTPFIITNKHVVSEYETVNVYFENAKKFFSGSARKCA